MLEDGKKIKVRLSRRLESIAKLVEGRTCADIGCDHGLLPAYLLLSGQINAGIAVDIRPGPLDAATENLRAFGLLEQIKPRLGDGLMPVASGEAETCVISGMGGMSIIEILSASSQTAASFRQLVLQPERDADALRRFLHTQRFLINREVNVFDRGHYYVVIDARPGYEPPYDDLCYLFGREPLQNKDCVLQLFLEKEAKKTRRLAMNIDNPPTSLMRYLAACEQALEIYYNI